MRKILFFSILTVLAFSAKSQYWFGPKVGIHGVSHAFQDENYKTDSLVVNPDVRWQVGFVLNYDASERYSVRTEINFERIGRIVKNEPPKLPNVYSRTTSSFLSIPLMLQVNFGTGAIQYYLNGGPKISWWMGGKGYIRGLDEFEEFLGPDYRFEYRFVYNEDKETFPESVDARSDVAIINSNQIQFALAVGAGAMFKIPNGSSILLDFRYSHGHSNMGFNGNPGFTFENYEENFEYANRMFSISVGYLVEFDQQLKIKGRSTNKESNRTKTKRNRPKKKR